MFQDNNPIFEFRGPWGVPVQIGATLFLLFIVLVDFSGTPRDFAFDLMFFAILVGSIYLHELGHAWGCLIQGVPVHRVMLYGGGGFCQPARSSTRSEKELIVIMGPIVNLFLWATAGLIAPMIADPEISWVFRTIAWVNGFLFLMNMLPVHPLDGGKLFELLLLRLMPSGLAIMISAGLGLVLAIFWIPMMVYVFWTTGLVLFFLPSARLHLAMLRRRRA
ncbi:site-2 protease family protein [Rhodobacteraceae bacterium]|nr:site-2 protease family protein [Paracoccaceae bacterium]